MPESDEERALRERARDAQYQLDRIRLTRVTTDVIQTITQPEFIERVREARRAADEGAGMEAGLQLLSIESLRAAGVDIPDDFRMTSRIFEDREKGIRLEVTDLPRDGDGVAGMMPNWGGCAGGGGWTFCGCGGYTN